MASDTPTLVSSPTNPGTAPRLFIWAAGGSMYYAFELQSTVFTDTYKNDIMAMGVNYTLPHDPGLFWKGGRFDNLSIELDLAAGVQTIIPDGKTLIQVVRDLFRMALPKVPGYRTPSHVFVKVGDWFLRKGYISSISVKWKAPYAPGGLPMTASVSISFQTDFSTVQSGQVLSYSFKMPGANDFQWVYPGA